MGDGQVGGGHDDNRNSVIRAARIILSLESIINAINDESVSTCMMHRLHKSSPRDACNAD